MMNIKNIFKKNQIIIYTMSLMLVAAGYFNYTNRIKQNSVETSIQEVVDENIGDAAYEEASTQNMENQNQQANSIGGTALVSSEDEESVLVNAQNTLNSTDVNQKIADVGDATLVNSNDVVEDDYFVKSKIEREAMYSQMLETYETILNSPNSSEAQKDKASMEMARINEMKNSIMICENLLETKGFKNCVIFVNEESVSVIIGAEGLEQEQTAQIQNIISRELGALIDNIHISIK